MNAGNLGVGKKLVGIRGKRHKRWQKIHRVERYLSNYIYLPMLLFWTKVNEVSRYISAENVFVQVAVFGPAEENRKTAKMSPVMVKIVTISRRS